mmetsp:Transcript_31526/g.82389  ORF Transcript_31526/g.82389 Transcript_31526/m.82389 type:complete len:254 (-) Transcript_31526:485-1246(-)
MRKTCMSSTSISSSSLLIPARIEVSGCEAMRNRALRASMCFVWFVAATCSAIVEPEEPTGAGEPSPFFRRAELRWKIDSVCGRTLTAARRQRSVASASFGSYLGGMNSGNSGGVWACMKEERAPVTDFLSCCTTGAADNALKDARFSSDEPSPADLAEDVCDVLERGDDGPPTCPPTASFAVIFLDLSFGGAFIGSGIKSVIGTDFVDDMHDDPFHLSRRCCRVVSFAGESSTSIVAMSPTCFACNRRSSWWR